MKFLPLLSTAVALVSAVPFAEPIPTPEKAALVEEEAAPSTEETAQLEEEFLSALAAVTTSTELEDGNSDSCPRVILIYARGSTQEGNMGTGVGPALAAALEASYPGDVWIQGVGGPYTAGLTPNLLPKGTTQGAIDEAKRLFNMANSKCPDSTVVTGGYSQGTAVVGNALTESSSTIQNQVAGAVLFGYTKNEQNGGRIPGFPTDKTAIFCNDGDAVCTGTLIILPPHMQYEGLASVEAPQFLVQKIDAA